MLIDCTHCQARVNGDELKFAKHDAGEVWPDSYRVALLRCPECKHILVAQQDMVDPGGFDSMLEPEIWSEKEP